ncbi:hypothetical protein ABE28_018795 [Peribacillus muralis]|uniref:Uncharacterized protein n=1 Tax=Peribacillus muralis TaxID=264697 RepID=A0A1B3XT78_9BACI|nr:hypothetical protein [Peribacillus muralis]AOH56420.1 hypothetical protein ABE28_018795 [Peribacillus muralis]
MLIESMSDYLYEPFYIPILLLLLGILYIGILIYSFTNVTFTFVGYGLMGISILTYLLVGLYMTGKGYYLDKHAPDLLVFGSIGFLELTILTYPYMFLTLAVVLGKKGE